MHCNRHVHQHLGAVPVRLADGHGLERAYPRLAFVQVATGAVLVLLAGDGQAGVAAHLPVEDAPLLGS